MDAVQNLGGCPTIVRSDCGSENVLVAAMQSYFRADGIDEFAGTKSHQYGSSPTNQRIEGWWSFFRKGHSGWWINFLKGMCDSGILELGNEFHMECLWFCFWRVIQNELDEVRNHWNSHYIRRSHHGTVPGIPDILFFLPGNTGAVDCLVPVSSTKIQQVEPQCLMEEEENVFKEYFEYLMETNSWDYAMNARDAFSLFQSINQLQV